MNETNVAAVIASIRFLAPEAILGVAACLLFLGGTIVHDRRIWGSVALAALGLAGVAFVAAGAPPAVSTAGQLSWDPLAWWFRTVALSGGAVLVLMSWSELSDAHAADYHACLLVAVMGVSLTGAASDLVTLFLALELISIPTYVLLYLPRHDAAAQEAALKYFLLSMFSSALLLFGFSYLYGLASSTNLSAVWKALVETRMTPIHSRVSSAPLALLAVVMVTAGLSFRIAAVPFHFYASDVYQGAPTPAAALLAFLTKAGGFAGLIRVFGFAAPATVAAAQSGELPVLLWILSAVTMTLGNVLALLQSNLKRLLAYSSVAHAGYMLIGLAVASQAGAGSALHPSGLAAVLFYLVAYGAMTLGVFGVLSYLGSSGRPVEAEDDLGGLSRTHPVIALLMALFLLSLIGIPLTAGFWGKLFLLWGALATRGERAFLFRCLAVIAALNAAVGGWYYLRILARMFLHNAVKPLPRPHAWPGLVAIWLCAVLTLVPGLYPAWLLRCAERATRSDTEPQSTDRRGEQQAEIPQEAMPRRGG